VRELGQNGQTGEEQATNTLSSQKHLTLSLRWVRPALIHRTTNICILPNALQYAPQVIKKETIVMRDCKRGAEPGGSLVDEYSVPIHKMQVNNA
jgi:hypothetical protein